MRHVSAACHGPAHRRRAACPSDTQLRPPRGPGFPLSVVLESENSSEAIPAMVRCGAANE